MASSKTCSIPGCDRPVLARGWCNAHYKRWRLNGGPLQGRTPDGDALRFIEEVALRHAGDDCLTWPYTKNDHGYGHVVVNGRSRGAHRFVCEKMYGPAPTKRHQAAHACGDRSCVSPKHLRWATPEENQADRLIHGTHNRGERCGAAKLTEADVREIRALAGTMSLRKIAERFPVHTTHVADIIKRKKWAWFDPEVGLAAREGGDAA